MTSILVLHHQRPDGETDAYHLKAGRRYHLGRGSQCQVRILDLKLSRQHCAFECGTDGWALIDLASTNGCSVDGERVAGQRPIAVGSRITAGGTLVEVVRIHDSAKDPAAPASADEDAQEHPEQMPLEPSGRSDRLAAAAARSADSGTDELQPQQVPARTTISDPLIPANPPRAQAPPAQVPPAPATPPEPQPDHDVLATMAPGQRPVDLGGDVHIQVLGRRIGPMPRELAQQLKAKELRGELTAADLAEWPEDPAPAAQRDESRTYYITLLGQRVGPLSRNQARELKARELRGELTAAEVERAKAG
jgi:pSer/pThr/pTyr-binding forkhead associated (FHA) protein